MAVKFLVDLIPRIIGFAVPAIGKLAKKETPEIGMRIAEKGAKLLLGGGAMVTAATSITLPEVPESWMVLLQQITTLIGAITTLIGTVMVAVGKSQTKDNPDSDPAL